MLADGTELPFGAVPSGLSVGPDGAIWYAENHSLGSSPAAPNGIGRITTAGVHQSMPMDTPLSVTPVLDVTVGPDGAMWYADTYWVNRVGQDGSVTRLPVSGGVFGIGTGPDGNVWFTKPANNVTPIDRVGRVSPTGQVAEFSAGISAGASHASSSVAPTGTCGSPRTASAASRASRQRAR